MRRSGLVRGVGLEPARIGDVARLGPPFFNKLDGSSMIIRGVSGLLLIELGKRKIRVHTKFFVIM